MGTCARTLQRSSSGRTGRCRQVSACILGAGGWRWATIPSGPPASTTLRTGAGFAGTCFPCSSKAEWRRILAVRVAEESRPPIGAVFTPCATDAAGHDHHLQHIKRADTGVHQFISGAGSKVRRTGNMVPDDGTRLAVGRQGFALASLDADRMRVQFVTYEGYWLYLAEIRRPTGPTGSDEQDAATSQASDTTEPGAAGASRILSSSTGLDAGFEHVLADGVDNLSGVTYLPHGAGALTKPPGALGRSFLAMTNDPPALLEYTFPAGPEARSRAPELVRTIRLEGFEDTEAVTWMGADVVAVAEGRGTRIRIFSIPRAHLDRVPAVPLTQAVHVNSTRALETGIAPAAVNKGLKGLSYDARDRAFYAVVEKNPMRVVRVSEVTEEIIDAFDAEAALGGTVSFTDLSAICFEPSTRTLLVVSGEAKRVARVSLDGSLIQAVSVPLDQPEGLALAEDLSEMLVVGTPNQLVRYLKAAT